MKHRELKALPEGTHLLCPRQKADDYARYDDLSQLDEHGKSIKDVVPESTAQKIKDAFTQESGKPTSKVYPMISFIAQPDLPLKHVTYRLIDVFTVKGTLKLLYLKYLLS